MEREVSSVNSPLSRFLEQYAVVHRPCLTYYTPFASLSICIPLLARMPKFKVFIRKWENFLRFQRFELSKPHGSFLFPKKFSMRKANITSQVNNEFR